MSWTKRQLVNKAYDEAGYAEYEFDLEPDQLQSALKSLEAMIGSWNGKGIRLGYPIASNVNEADLDTDSNLSDMHVEAVYSNLALRICSSIGKQPAPTLRQVARETYKSLLNSSIETKEQVLPTTLPSGAGNKGYRNHDNYTRSPEDDISLGSDSGTLDF